jgi:hypothetical protein
MCMKQERDRLEMWFEKERCESNITPRLRTGASEVKVRDEELDDRCIGGSGIFLIWSGKPRTSNSVINSVFEGLRQRRLGGMH